MTDRYICKDCTGYVESKRVNHEPFCDFSKEDTTPLARPCQYFIPKEYIQALNFDTR